MKKVEDIIKNTVDDVLKTEELDKACATIGARLKNELENQNFIYQIVSEWYKDNSGHTESGAVFGGEESRVFSYKARKNEIEYSFRVYQISL